MADKETIEEAASRIVELEDELEAGGSATTDAEIIAQHRALLHDWVETIVGVVASPGVGRVTLIHDNGHQSKIASPSLPHILSRPVNFTAR